MDRLQIADEDDERSIRELGAELPLDSVRHEDARIWKASLLIPKGRVADDGTLRPLAYSGYNEFRQATTRMESAAFAQAVDDGLVKVRGFDRRTFSPYSQLLDTSRGLSKNHFYFYRLKHLAAVEAWCVGDRPIVEELLREHVQFLGPYRRRGHGQVKSITVVEDERAHALWRLRALPMTMIGYDEPWERFAGTVSAEPPYWTAEKATLQSLPAVAIW